MTTHDRKKLDEVKAKQMIKDDLSSDITAVGDRLSVLRIRQQYLISKSGKNDAENHELKSIYNRINYLINHKEQLESTKGMILMFDIQAAQAIDASAKENAPATIQIDKLGRYCIAGHGRMDTYLKDGQAHREHFIINENGVSERTVDMLQRLQGNTIPNGAEVVLISCAIGELETDMSRFNYTSVKASTSEPGAMYDFGGTSLSEDLEFRTVAVS